MKHSSDGTQWANCDENSMQPTVFWPSLGSNGPPAPSYNEL
jgi:hypothetical protein